METTLPLQPAVATDETPDAHHVTDPAAVDEILTALEDEYCRRMLEAMTAEFQTAQQISERCGMPISTTYRKLNTLTDVGLVDTSIRLRRSGHHTREFAKAFRTVNVLLDGPGGTAVTIESPLSAD